MKRLPASEQVQVNLQSRRLSIMLLAVTAVWIGAVMIMTGAPNFIEDWFSPWSRVVLGTLIFTAGCLTCIGCVLTDERTDGWWIQVFGLSLLTLWYGGMGAAYIGLIITQGAQWADIGQPLPPNSTGRAYVPLIYLGLLATTAVPLLTLVRLGRPRR